MLSYRNIALVSESFFCSNSFVSFSGDHRETVNLTCPEPLARATRTTDPNAAASHRGHNPLLMDGDVTIAYQHRSATATATAAAFLASNQGVDDAAGGVVNMKGGEEIAATASRSKVRSATGRPRRRSSSSITKEQRSKELRSGMAWGGILDLFDIHLKIFRSIENFL